MKILKAVNAAKEAKLLTNELDKKAQRKTDRRNTTVIDLDSSQSNQNFIKPISPENNEGVFYSSSQTNLSQVILREAKGNTTPAQNIDSVSKQLYPSKNMTLPHRIYKPGQMSEFNSVASDLNLNEPSKLIDDFLGHSPDNIINSHLQTSSNSKMPKSEIEMYQFNSTHSNLVQTTKPRHNYHQKASVPVICNHTTHDGQDYPGILINIDFDYQKKWLLIRIIEACNLSTAYVHTPIDKRKCPRANAYIKTYLLPDRGKHMKRKTKTVRGANPIFKETVKYRE